MVLTVKHRFSIYKRYESDIWGIMYTDKEALTIIKSRRKSNIEKLIKSPYLKFFFKLYQEKQKKWEMARRRYIYRLDIMPPVRRRRMFNKRFVSVRLTRLYFLTFQDYQFRKMFKRAAKMDGNLEMNYCYMLEGRLLSVVYRSNFLSNIFQIIRFIKENNVCIDFKANNSINTYVKVGKFLTFNNNIGDKLLLDFKRRLKSKAVLFTIPRYMFISYKFIFFLLIAYPTKRDLVYPISLDIQRITGYY